MPTFRKVEAIEAVKGEYGFWYHNGVFLAPDRGDGLAPLGYEPAEAADHQWSERHESTPFCRSCGNEKRLDGNDGPCKGPDCVTPLTE